jgi:hypothetical protein
MGSHYQRGEPSYLLELIDIRIIRKKFINDIGFFLANLEALDSKKKRRKLLFIKLNDAIDISTSVVAFY